MNTNSGTAPSALKHHSGDNHVVHRLAHAIYGLIVLAAVTGELSAHDDDMSTAILLVGGGAAVLVFAHTYSQFAAAASMAHERPPWHVIWSSLVDQLALALPAATAMLVFAAAEVGILSNRAAYNIVLLAALATLFGLGVTMGVHRKRGLGWSLALGVSNTAVGFLIIGIEAAAAH